MQELHDLNPSPLRKREYFVVSSMLFGLFFGAGNLIFPIHLGQLAGGALVTRRGRLFGDCGLAAAVVGTGNQCD